MQYRALAPALVAVVAAVLGCQRAEPKGDYRSSPFGRDVDRICNAVEQSGATSQPEGAHQLLVAQWLGANVESEEARTFLAGLTQLDGAAKAKALEEQARKVGLPGCPLAAEWK